jgi:hypothetical protein
MIFFENFEKENWEIGKFLKIEMKFIFCNHD